MSVLNVVSQVLNWTVLFVSVCYVSQDIPPKEMLRQKRATADGWSSKNYNKN